jgi:outer membrane protein assembly factor BamB
MVVVGHFSGAAMVGDAPLASSEDGGAVVAMLDETGHVLWARGLTDESGGLAATAVSIAGDGAMVVLGAYRPKPPKEAFPNPEFREGFFLARFDGAGQEVWRRRFGDTRTTAMGRGLATDDQVNTTVAIVYRDGTLDLGGGAVEHGEPNRLLLARFDSGGALIWTHGVSESPLQDIEAVSGDNAGNVYVAGSVGSEMLGQPYRSDFFVSRFDAQGSRSWSRRFSAANQHEGGLLTADPCGGVIAGTNARGVTESALIVRLNDTGDVRATQTLAWPEHRWTGGLAPLDASTIFLFGAIGESDEDLFVNRISM